MYATCSYTPNDVTINNYNLHTRPESGHASWQLRSDRDPEQLKGMKISFGHGPPRKISVGSPPESFSIPPDDLTGVNFPVGDTNMTVDSKVLTLRISIGVYGHMSGKKCPFLMIFIIILYIIISK